MTQDLTVIIPVYNRKSIVIDALDSVAAQTVLPRQVVVVDDGSTDGTVESVNQWIGKRRLKKNDADCTFRLLRQEKQSAAAARQFGMSASTPTKFIAFLDSDDLWPKDLIKRTVHALNNDSSIVAGSVDRRFIDEQRKPFQVDDCSKLAKSPLKWIFRHGAGIASCTVCKWEAVVAAGGWDPSCLIAEDALLFTHLSMIGTWVHVPGLAVTFRHGNAGAKDEEGNLSKKYPDTFQRYAVTHEEIYEQLCDRVGHTDRKCMRQQIGIYWYRAGKQLQGIGEESDAIDCFQKALRWAPRLLRPRIRLLRMQRYRNNAA